MKVWYRAIGQALVSNLLAEESFRSLIGARRTNVDAMLRCVSVRDGDTVKHYRIRQLDEGGFFIARRVTFRTLSELVVHYMKDADGLCVHLQNPCSQVSLPPHLCVQCPPPEPLLTGTSPTTPVCYLQDPCSQVSLPPHLCVCCVTRHNVYR